MTTHDPAIGHAALPREAKRQLAIVAVHLLRSLLIGDPPAYTAALWERMKNPRPGDLVMEDSTIQALIRRDPDLADDRWDGQLVPFLREEWRPMPVSADWDPGDPPTRLPPEERVLVCQNPDGTEFTWTNAELLAVPTSLDWLEDR